MQPVDTSRGSWLGHLTKLATPVLTALANERLRATMSVEQKPTIDRTGCSHLEAFGRLMAGMAPWLESGTDEPGRAEMTELAQKALHHAVNPGSKDFCNFTTGGQPLLDHLLAVGRRHHRVPVTLEHHQRRHRRQPWRGRSTPIRVRPRSPCARGSCWSRDSIAPGPRRALSRRSTPSARC